MLREGGILPKPKIATVGPGIMGPEFSYAAAVPAPPSIGVGPGDTFGSVMSAVSGVAYYSDVIGFGAPSTKWSTGANLKPIGIQVWMRTGVKCSNGADMWTYMNGIPEGTALGTSVAKKLAEAGLPPLRGLAGGIMEDLQAAFDPSPIMKSVFGTGFPSCKLVEMPVGDQDGNISTVDAKGNTVYYVENPETVTRRGGVSYQTRWALDYEISQTEWQNTNKVLCPNGSSITTGCVESFCGYSRKNEGTPKWKLLLMLSLAGAGVLLLSHGLRMRRKS
jgi:hypothetical protein